MTDPTSTVPLKEIDLSDHDAFVEEVPHHWFTTLRDVPRPGVVRAAVQRVAAAATRDLPAPYTS